MRLIRLIFRILSEQKFGKFISKERGISKGENV